MSREQAELVTSPPLGESIKVLRKQKGYSLAFLAKDAGISKTYLWQLEHDMNSPTIGVLRRIATGLDTSVSELLGPSTPSIQNGPQQLPFPGSLFQSIWDALQAARTPEAKALIAKRIGGICPESVQLLAPARSAPKPTGNHASPDWLIARIMIILAEFRFTESPPIQEIPAAALPIGQMNKQIATRLLSSLDRHLPPHLVGSHLDEMIVEELPQLLQEGGLESAVSMLTEQLGSNDQLPLPGYQCLIEGMEAETKGQESRAIDAYENALRLLENPVTAGFISLSLGRLYAKRQHILAIQRQKRALSLLERHLGSPEKVALCTQVGWLSYRAGNFDEGTEYFRRSIGIIEGQYDKKALVLSAYRGLGSIYSTLGQFERAIRVLDKSLQVCEAVGDRREAAWIMYRLAVDYVVVGQWDEALRMLNQALQMVKDMDIPDLRSQIYNQLGHIKNLQGDFIAALDFHDKALGLQEEVTASGKGNQGYAFVFRHLGDVYLSSKRYDEALYNLMEAIDRFTKLGVTYQQALNYSLLSETVALLGIHESAVRLAEKALRFARDAANEFQEAIARRALGFARWKAGNREEAKVQLQQALDLFQRVGAVYHDARTSFVLAGVLEDAGDGTEARQLLNRARDLLGQLGAQADLVRINQRMNTAK